MDSVFQLSNEDRVRYLRNLMHSFGSSYVCLWTYSPHLNILYCEDGHFQVEASSSAGVSIAETLFNEYKRSVINVGNRGVPGLAFREKNPCLELQELDLQSLAWSKSQSQFYAEAKIKTAIFLGCEGGEIELGMSKQMKMEIPSSRARDEEKKQSEGCWSRFEDEEADQVAVTEAAAGCGMMEKGKQHYTTSNTETIIPTTISNPGGGGGGGIIIDDQPGAWWLEKRIPPFPSAESTDAALTKAYLAILSSPSCSSSSSSQSYQITTREKSAFTSYHQRRRSGSEKSSRAPESSLMRGKQPIISTRQTQTLFKRAIAFYRGIHFRSIALQGSSSTPTPAATRPTSNQLHHMISERRRREKINDSFQTLRSLLPQPTKKDKASVLRTAQEYLSSLKAQVSELNTRNQELEARLVTVTSRPHVDVVEAAATTQPLISSNVDETLAVKLIPVADESTSTQSLVDLQLLFRGQTSLPDLLLRILPFLKQQATVVSIQAQTHDDLQQSPAAEHQIPTALVTFRLRIQGIEWDESAFIKAIRRLFADLNC